MSLIDFERVGFDELLSQRSRAEAKSAGATVDNVSFWTPFWPPAVVKDTLTRLNATDVDYRNFDTTVRSQLPGAVSPSFLASWAAQFAEFQKFRDETIDSADMGVFKPPTIDTNAANARIADYQAKLLQWSALFRAQNPNAVPAAPAPQLPSVPQSPGGGNESGFPWWGTALLTTAALGAVAYLGYSAYSTIKGGTSILSYVTGSRRDRPMPIVLPYSIPSRDCQSCGHPRRGPQPVSRYDDDHDFDD